MDAHKKKQRQNETLTSLRQGIEDESEQQFVIETETPDVHPDPGALQVPKTGAGTVTAVVPMLPVRRLDLVM
jgi:hypothetical protein